MRTILAATALSLSACTTPVVTTAPAGCSSLIPSSWIEGVPPPPLPEGNLVGDWISFGDAAIGKLDMANARTKDAIELQRRCEERDRQAVKQATRPRFLGIAL